MILGWYVCLYSVDYNEKRWLKAGLRKCEKFTTFKSYWYTVCLVNIMLIQTLCSFSSDNVCTLTVQEKSGPKVGLRSFCSLCWLKTYGWILFIPFKVYKFTNITSLHFVWKTFWETPA